jgi:hypothetical protein
MIPFHFMLRCLDNPLKERDYGTGIPPKDGYEQAVQ